MNFSSNKSFQQIIELLRKDALDEVETLFYELEKKTKTKSKLAYLLKIRYHRQRREYHISHSLIKEFKNRFAFGNTASEEFYLLIEEEAINYKFDEYRKLQISSATKQRINDRISHGYKLIKQINENELDEYCLGMFYDLHGSMEYYSKNLDTAITLFNQAKGILTKIDDTVSIAMNSMNIGFVYLHSGNLEKSMTEFEKVEELSIDFYDQEIYFWAVFGIASVLLFKGEIDKSLEFHQKSLKLLKQLDKPILEPDIYTQLGIIYWEKGYYGMATENFSKVITRPFEDINFLPYSMSLFYSSLIYLELGEYDRANEFIEEINGKAERSGDPLLIQANHFLKALQLKYSNKLLEKMRSKELLSDLVNSGTIHPQLLVVILSHLTELQFIELKALENYDTLIELKQTINQLYNISLMQNSERLLVDTHLALSKIAFYEFDFDQAEKLLIQGIAVAKEKGLTKMISKLSEEYEVLENTLQNETSSENKRMDRSFDLIENVVKSIGRDEIKSLPSELAIETPILVVILSDAGITRYIRKFDENIKSENLIGSFITAVNSFIKSIFSSDRPIEQISYYEFQIIIKQFEANLVCYVFKGHPQQPKQRLKELVAQIYENKFLLNKFLLSANNSDILESLDDNESLNALIDSIISPT